MAREAWGGSSSIISLRLSSSSLPHRRREADVPNALVVATPVSVKRKEAASLEVLVVEPPRNGADLAERPPAPSSCMYIDVHEWSRHSHLLQSVHDVPLALPLLQQKSAQATAEMTVDTVHSRVMLPIADREVAEPTAEIDVHALDALVERLPPVARRKLLQPLPEALPGRLRHQDADWPRLQPM